MQLRHTLPLLPEGQGTLHTNPDALDDNPHKQEGVDFVYNPLREAAQLQRQDGEPLETYGYDEMLNILAGRKTTDGIIRLPRFIDHLDAPDSIDSDGLAAGAIAKFDPATRQLVVQEVVVHPELQGKGIGSYILTRLTNDNATMPHPPTELVIDTETYITPAGLLEKLEEVGFRHKDAAGRPAMWLPQGYTYAEGDKPDEDTNSPIGVHGPHGLAGTIQSSGNDRTLDTETGEMIDTYVLRDPEGLELGTIRAASDHLAAIALLNPKSH